MEPWSPGDSAELTFEEWMMVEAVLPEWSEVDPGVDYVSAGVEAHRSRARFEGMMRANGWTDYEVRTLVSRDGVAHMIIDVVTTTVDGLTSAGLHAADCPNMRKRPRAQA